MCIMLGRRVGLPAEGVHVILAVAPLAPIEQLYQVVFEKILGETISTNPVQVVGLQ
jgi:hypothetical protein